MISRIVYASRAACALVVSTLMVVAGISRADTSPTIVKGPDLETLKRMVGDWTVATKGIIAPVTFHITSGGTAVMETMFPGTPQEMVTLFTQEGSNIAVTHFCTLNNQPRLVSLAPTAANQLRFEFESGGNLDPSRDQFNHGLIITFLDNDHVKQEWESYDHGKLDHINVEMFTRKL